MLEQISSLVRQYGQDAVVNNPAIPSDQNNAVLAEATSTITGGMQNMLAGGGLGDIISMFTGGNSKGGGTSGSIAGILKNPIVLMMVGHLISKLMQKFKMSHAQASQISNSLIPNVLGGLVGKINSDAPEDDNFDFNDLIGSLAGGSGGFDLQGMLRQFTGGSNGGGIDLQDIVSKVTTGAQERQEEQVRAGGGIGDLIRGFFS